MTRRTISFIISVAAIAALAIGQLGAGAQTDQFGDDREIAANNGLTLGPIPDELRVDMLPDLVPVGDGADILGYAFAHEVFAEFTNPNVIGIAYGVYHPDGKSLVGYVVPGRGFIPGKDPMVTTAPALVPDDL